MAQGGFHIIIRDHTGKAVQALESAIRNLDDWREFWEDRNGVLSKAWAGSRVDMFLTSGSSTGPGWTPCTPEERAHYVPIKKWLLKMRKRELPPSALLRWSKTGNRTVGRKERLYPGMTVTSHPDYIYASRDNTVVMGTSTPWAWNHDNGIGEWKRRYVKRYGKLGAAVVGRASVPTPKRPLIRFGDAFIESVRKHMQTMAVNKGGRVGLTTDEVAARIRLSRRVRGKL